MKEIFSLNQNKYSTQTGWDMSLASRSKSALAPLGGKCAFWCVNSILLCIYINMRNQYSAVRLAEYRFLFRQLNFSF